MASCIYKRRLRLTKHIQTEGDLNLAREFNFFIPWLDPGRQRTLARTATAVIGSLRLYRGIVDLLLMLLTPVLLLILQWTDNSSATHERSDTLLRVTYIASILADKLSPFFTSGLLMPNTTSISWLTPCKSIQSTKLRSNQGTTKSSRSRRNNPISPPQHDHDLHSHRNREFIRQRALCTVTATASPAPNHPLNAFLSRVPRDLCALPADILGLYAASHPSFHLLHTSVCNPYREPRGCVCPRAIYGLAANCARQERVA